MTEKKRSYHRVKDYELLTKEKNQSHGFDPYRAIHINDIRIDRYTNIVHTPHGQFGPLAPRPLQVFIARLFGLRDTQDIATAINTVEHEQCGLRDAITPAVVRSNIHRIAKEFPGLRDYVLQRPRKGKV